MVLKKSTVLRLICLLYPLDNGIIKVDGYDIMKFKKSCLTSSISMIFSDPYLFDGSIYENIAIGDLKHRRGYYSSS